MKKFFLVCFMLLITGGFISGCFFDGDEESTPTKITSAVDSTLISSTIPVNGAVDVPLNRKLVITFSEAMDPSTINTTTFLLMGPGAMPVPGTVDTLVTGALSPEKQAAPGAVNAQITGALAPEKQAVPGGCYTATFTPASNFTPSTMYTATITTGVKQMTGKLIESNISWTFTSGTTLDTTIIMESTTVPVNNLTNVAVNLKPTIIFGEPMDPFTVNPTTFTLTGPGMTPIAGTVTYVGDTATFTPSNLLPNNTTYIATITTGVKDLAGNPLTADIVWTFTTGAILDTTAPTVISTGAYGTTGITSGATGLSINRVSTVIFSEVMDPLTINKNTFTVKGPTGLAVAGIVTYVGSIATFTPAANLAANTLYVLTVTTGAKDLAGNALAANYVWSFTTGAAPDTIAPVVIATGTYGTTGVTSGATGVSLNKTSTVTFSEAMDPATINKTTFTVKGPDGLSVAGTVGYIGVIATFTPAANLAANTLYTSTITTGVKDLAGNSIAAAYTWSSTTGAAPDTITPTVTANGVYGTTGVTSGAVGIPINSAGTVIFSEAMDPATINITTFIVKGPDGKAVAGTVTYIGNTATFTPATFTPAVNLTANTLYTTIITTGVKDLAGNALAADYSWTYTTGAASDVMAPVVVSNGVYGATGSTSGAVDMPINRSATVVFSEAMDPATLTIDSFTVKGPDGAAVAGTVGYIGMTATFIPAVNLTPNTLYITTVTKDAKDLAGNALAADYVFSYTTGAVPDITAPTVTSVTPLNNAGNVATNSILTVIFGEEMDPLTMNTQVFTLKQGANAIAGTITHTGTTATFTPASSLSGSTQYTATITIEAKDLAGNALASNYVWSFTTPYPGPAPDTTKPLVTSVTPLNGAVAVAVNSKPAAVFNESMNSSTINTTNFTLTGPGATVVAGAVSYSGTTATFTPTAVLSGSTLYTATITTGVQDASGNTLAANYVWNFTTADVTAPAVISKTPASGASGVIINAMPTATFSEAMDSSTINTSNFTLTGPGLTAVVGTVSFTGTIATFTPAVNLLASTLYTATITTGVKDSAGNSLAANYVWTFTTGTTPASSPLPVNLGTAGDFAVLAKSGIDTVSPSVITGNIGVSPAAATYITGFSLTADPSNIFSTSPQITGKIYASNYAVPTPSKMTTAISDMETAYTDAAGRATPDFTELYSGDISGRTLSAGLYKWGTNVLINTDVTLDGGANDVWIFQVAQGITQANGSRIILAGGAQAKNIFWQSFGQVTIGTTAHFEGTILCQTSIALNTGATINGRLMAQTAVTLQSGTVTQPGAAPDMSAPTILSTDTYGTTGVKSGATGLPINTISSATFSEAMEPLTITTATFTMKGTDGIVLTGTVNYAGTTATFTPAANLAPGSLYTSEITVGVRDISSNAMAANYAWSWTTGGTADTAAPVMASVTPAAATTAVALTSTPSIVFNEAMNQATINTTNFTLTGPGATPVSGAVTYSGTTATFTPTANLLANVTYTATVKTGVKDLAGNALAADYVWTFKTVDTISPTVSSVTPLNASTAVALTTAPTAVFSEAMDLTTITTATFTLTGPGAAVVAGSVGYAGTTATFTPTSSLVQNTLYTAEITIGAKDLAGNALAAKYTWSFTTVDNAAPIVAATGAYGATGVTSGAVDLAVNRVSTVTFNEAMDTSTITLTTFTVKGTDGVALAGAVSYAGTIATFTPAVNLAPGSLYTSEITVGVKDLAGNAIASSYIWSWTTGSVVALGPAPVELGTAKNFAILAKSTITTTGTTAITGHIGLSPAARSFMTGFSETLDATNVFATSDIVTGKMYAANMAPPTPANMTTAISNMETAYTDAAGRTTPDFTELYSGDISGRILVPGLYKWGTGVSINTDVTLDGGPNDVFIFQIAQDLTMASAKKVLLTGGVLPKNIFWQVGGQTTLGTTSDFKGIILCKTQIAMQTGAVINGRALAQTAVTLDANAVTQPAE